MKVHYLIYLTLLMPLLCYSYPAPDSNNNDSNDSKITKLLDKSIIVEDSDHADTETAQISKRSGGGSFDFISHIKSSILGGIGKASASSSSGSSGHKSNEHGYHANSVDFDPWSLKKSVLNTLFQAVKAITGGVTAIKGQLIKGSGYVLSAGGKLVSASGDKVTDVGKAIVHSAQLSPHNEHGHGGGYGHGSHPFSKFSSLSSGSSGHGSSGGGGGGGGGGHGGHGPVGHGSGGHGSGGHGHNSHEHHVGPDIHTETITTYDIPSGHTHYGPPSKPPSFGSATHHYLPPGGYVASFEQPESYGYQTHEEFNKPNEISIHYHTYRTGHTGPTNPFDYGQLKGSNNDLSQDQAKKAADALKDIIHLLPLTTDKKITQPTDTGYGSTGASYYSNSNYYNKESESSHQLGPIEAISITESVSTSYNVDPRNPSSQSHYEITQSENSEVSSNNAHNYNFKNSDNLSPPISDSHPYDIYRDMSQKYKSHSHENYVTSHQNNYQSYQTSESNRGSADIDTVIAALETLPSNHKNDLQGSYSSPSLSYTMPLRSHTLPFNPTNKQNNFLNYPSTSIQKNGIKIQHRQANSNSINNQIKIPVQNYKPFVYQLHDSDSEFRKRRVYI